MIKKIKNYINKNNGIWGSFKAFIEAIKRYGLIDIVKHFFGIEIKDLNNYDDWIIKNEIPYTDEEVKNILASFTINPKISFIIPVYNVDELYLRACIDSIRHQYYENWELCIADDCSTKEHIQPVLLEYMNEDSRIKVVFREKNGHISEASNSALEIATGEYLALVDNDDFIEKHALLEIVKMINLHPNADMLYTDEDKVSADGMKRSDPFFKPDWSPDAFLCHMYLCHMGVYRREIALKIGGFRTEFNGSQDYDFALRFSEQTTNIFHVPEVLYHWRMIPTSTAAGTGNKNYAFDAGVRAKKDIIKRRNYLVDIEVNESYGTTHFDFLLEQEDKISVIVQIEKTTKSLLQTLENIYQKSTYENFEVILLNTSILNDNNRIQSQIQKAIMMFPQTKVITLPKRSLYALVQAENISQIQGSILVFIEADTIIDTPSWLEKLGGQARSSHTGMVGSKTLYQNDKVEQAGILFVKQKPVYAFNNFFSDELGYFGRLQLSYNYLAIVPNGMAISKEKFLQAVALATQNEGKFNSYTYQSIDIAIQLYTLGYFNVVRNDVIMYTQLTHKKSMKLFNKKENRTLSEKWGYIYQDYDPFYNKNLMQNKGDFSY